jgi:Mandelate racemase / muconate lactonizing enzyme, N-terminal domain
LHASKYLDKIRRRPQSLMKIVSLETLRLDEFYNVLWVRIGTDRGFIGLGETFYGAGAVEAHIHETLAGRLLGRDPLHIERLNKEMVDLPVAQSSTGAEYRAASAIDIALWDLFGKVCGQPVHQLLGGLCTDKVRVYNTCAGYRYVRGRNIRPVDTWNLSEQEGPYEDLFAFMNRADVLAESLLEQGITAMKIWPFDPAAQETGGLYITAEQMKAARSRHWQRRGIGHSLRTIVPVRSLSPPRSTRRSASPIHLSRRRCALSTPAGTGNLSPPFQRSRAGLCIPWKGLASVLTSNLPSLSVQICMSVRVSSRKNSMLVSDLTTDLDVC